MVNLRVSTISVKDLARRIGVFVSSCCFFRTVQELAVEDMPGGLEVAIQTLHSIFLATLSWNDVGSAGFRSLTESKRSTRC